MVVNSADADVPSSSPLRNYFHVSKSDFRRSREAKPNVEDLWKKDLSKEAAMPIIRRSR